MWWERGSLLLAALPETTDGAKKLCAFLFLHRIGFVLHKVSSRRFIAGNSH